MPYYNPMLEKLQKQIEQHNKDAESELEKVAFKQNIVTIITLVFNIFVFITLDYFFGKGNSAFLDIPNKFWNLIITLLSLLITFPMASKYSRRNLRKKMINFSDIDPSLNFAGKWTYRTKFKIESPDDNSDEYKLLKAGMNEYEEDGESVWTQNIFDLKIDFANTNVKDGNKKATVSWKSDPISYDDHEVKWSYSGIINFKEGERYANIFSGIEMYKVNKRNKEGYPIYLKGELTSTVLIGKKFYTLSADSSFTRDESTIPQKESSNTILQDSDNCSFFCYLRKRYYRRIRKAASAMNDYCARGEELLNDKTN